MADLPKELQDAIAASTRAAFAALLKEGYAVAPRDAAPSRPPPRHGEVVQRGADRPSRPPARGPRNDGPRGPRVDGPRGPRSGGPGGGAPRGGPRGPKPTR